MKLSVIIPVKNGGQTLDICLRRIRSQTFKDLEIIILDSTSVDDSKEIAQKFNAKFINIPLGEFNHGLTRNRGVSFSTSEFIYFTVQDAWIAEDDMFEKMLNHFEDAKVMGVTGHQAIPYGDADKNPAFWFKRFSEPIIETRFFETKDNFESLPEEIKFNLSSWDNVSSMYRKSALIEIPFEETDFSEDWIWANRALKNGFKIIRDPGLVVFHYHHLLFPYAFRTNFTVNYHFLCHFNYRPKLPWSIIGLIRSINTLTRKRRLTFFKKIYWIIHNCKIKLAIFLSISIFKFAYFIGGKKLLNTLYEVFFKDVPQGMQNFKKVSSLSRQFNKKLQNLQ